MNEEHVLGRQRVSGIPQKQHLGPIRARHQLGRDFIRRA